MNARALPALLLLAACSSPPRPSTSVALPASEPDASPPPAPVDAPTPSLPMVEPIDEQPRQAVPDAAIGTRGALPPRFTTLGSCKLSGDAPHRPVRIDPASGPPFLVQLHGKPLAVTLGKGEGTSARVDFDGGVRFSGATRELVVSVRRPLVRHEGMVHVPAGARLVTDAEGPSGEVRVMTSVDIPIDAPCDALVLGAREPPSTSGLQRAPNVVAAGEAPLLLAPSPRAAPSLLVPPGMVFTRIAGGVDFVKISHRGWDGVVVSGFVPAPRVMDEGMSGTGFGRMGCGCGTRGFAIARRGPQDPYEGPARLRDGTPVYGERDGGVWATVVGGPDVIVKWAGGRDPWVQIETLPGVDDVVGNPCNCAGISHAFVLRDAVGFSL